MVKKTLVSGFLFLAFLLSAKGVFAATTASILNHPSQVQTETPFSLEGKIQAEPNTSFYLKIRVGSSTSSLTKGLTYNPSNPAPNDWLSDNDTWTNFPLVTTDSAGSWQGQITGKISSTASSGVDFLVLRIRKVATTTTYDSDAAQINVLPTTPTPAPGSGNIILSEFMPNPDGGNEWAEVFNPQDSEIDIGGWKIDDVDGASSPYTIPEGTKLTAKSYALFSFSAKLNNSGDTIRLLNPAGEVIETYSFGETTKGASFAKDSQGNWQATITPTPGAVNKITLPSNPSKAATTKIKNPSGPSLPQTDPINPSSADQPTGNHNLATDSTNSGKVAGVSNEKDRNSNLATLLIAAGLSFLVTAVAWPVIEKQLWKK